jgi:hypothetical protein
VNVDQESFTVTFVRHYSCITGALTNVLDKSRMANRVVHISVQLLSPPLLAYKMVVEHKLLHVVLASLRHMINTVLTVDSNLGRYELIVDEYTAPCYHS